MIIKDLIFLIFVLITILSAGYVVFARKPVHSAFSLLFTFFGIAGLYIFLGADFLAASQVMVYVGGILVLILFGVLLTHRISDIRFMDTFNRHWWISGAGCFILFLILGYTVIKTPWETHIPEKAGNTTHAIGTLLLKTYLLPFEVASLLLLVAAIGAVVIIRKEIK